MNLVICPKCKTNIDERKARTLSKVKESNGKKVVIIGSSPLETSGHGKTLRTLGIGLKNKGHKIFFMPLNYSMSQLTLWNDVHLLPTGHHPQIKLGTDENFLPRIAEYLTNIGDIDYIIIHGDRYHMNEFGLGNLNLQAIKAKIIFYTTPDSDGFQCMEMQQREGKRDLFNIADKIISTSEFGKGQIKKWEGYDVDVITQTVDINNFKPVSGSHDKKELRKLHNFKEDDFIIFSGGRIATRKRHYTTLDVAAKFINDTENTYLLMLIPYDTDEGFLDSFNPIDYVKTVLKKEYGRDFCEEGRIIFLDGGTLGNSKIDEIHLREFYQISDVYLSSSSAEGFGLFIGEAMASGIVPVVPNNCTMPELLGHESSLRGSDVGDKFQVTEAGILVDCVIKGFPVGFGLKSDIASAENLYQALSYLHQDKELQGELGKNARKRAEKLFSGEEFINKWNGVLIKGFEKRRKVMNKNKEGDTDGTKIPTKGSTTTDSQCTGDTEGGSNPPTTGTDNAGTVQVSGDNLQESNQ